MRPQVWVEIRKLCIEYASAVVQETVSGRNYVAETGQLLCNKRDPGRFAESSHGDACLEQTGIVTRLVQRCVTLFDGCQRPKITSPETAVTSVSDVAPRLMTNPVVSGSYVRRMLVHRSR